MNIEKLDSNMVVKDPEKGLYWHNAKSFTIEGKGWDDTKSFYQRLPSKAESIVREPVWSICRASTGISVHFSSNSPSLAVKWDGFEAMTHMTATGVSGLDLYVKHNGEWKWLSIGRPAQEQNEVELFSNFSEEYRDYILYLPLYNEVHEVELGIPESFEIKAARPREKKPIVFYGTSITQGGCASRAGMCYSAILGRWLDNPTVNLGISGNGVMEPEVIDLLCELDPSIYVIDCMPNMVEAEINEREENAIRKLRQVHPDTPIVLVDNTLYCDAFLNEHRMKRYLSSNAAQLAVYNKLIEEGFTNLYHVKDLELIGSDGEGTIDGVHFTDLGYMRFSESLIQPLREILDGV